MLGLERRRYEVVVVAQEKSEIAVRTPDAVEDTTLRYVRKKGIQETSLQQIRPPRCAHVHSNYNCQHPLLNARRGIQLIRPTTPLGQG